MRVGLRGALTGAIAVLALAGCGGGGGSTSLHAAGSEQRAGGNGRLGYAIAPVSGDLDPLQAKTLAEQTLSRQLFEPLVASLDGPYGRRRNVPGAALVSRHSGDRRVWSLQLRPGIRFQDGRLLDADAVLANVRRWRASPIGQGLLPGMIGADGPRPDLVRFVFAGPVEDLPRRLSDPRLGLVSPDAIGPGAGAGPLRRVAQAGSGPFELAARSAAAIVLRRNGGWWGSRSGLGPALDQLTFRIAATGAGRLALLRAGAVRVAGDIGLAAARRLHGDPLFTTVAERSPHPIGLERSVRGLTAWRPESLSGVWLAVVGDG